MAKKKVMKTVSVPTLQEIEMARELLRYMRQQFDCPIYFKEGNHCERWKKYLMLKAPELLGCEDFQLNVVLRLGEMRTINKSHHA